jgi:hypothetical protein
MKNLPGPTRREGSSRRRSSRHRLATLTGSRSRRRMEALADANPGKSNGINSPRTAVGLRLMCRFRQDDRGMVSAPPATSEAVVEGITTGQPRSL